jgi:hypothetical protein
MRGIFRIQVALGLFLIVTISPCSSTESDIPKEESENTHIMEGIILTPILI